MTDTTTIASTIAPANGKQRAPRVSRSEREWLDANGAIIAEEGDVAKTTGFSYHLKALGKTFSWDHRTKPTAAVYMLASFGGMTLAGNVASGKTPVEAFDAISERFALIATGEEWVSREGVSGPRYNADLLAQAISVVKHGSFNKKGELQNSDECAQHTPQYRVKIGPDCPKIKVRSATGAEIEMDYGQAALKNIRVKEAYDRLAGNVQTSVDML